MTPRLWPNFAAVLLLALLAPREAAAQSLEKLHKEWPFQSKKGEAKIEIDRTRDGRIILSILAPPCEACASFEEETSALEKVLKELPGIGLDPRKISMITKGVDEPEARVAVADAALRSKLWLSCIRQSYCPANQTLVNLLNETNAFAPIYKVMEKYGLKGQVASAEKVSLQRANQIDGVTIPPGVSKTTKVPINGQLEILLAPGFK
jgi:hypothetical protein